jgi:hypothetical protein
MVILTFVIMIIYIHNCDNNHNDNNKRNDNNNHKGDYYHNDNNYHNDNINYNGDNDIILLITTTATVNYVVHIQDICIKQI